MLGPPVRGHDRDADRQVGRSPTSRKPATGFLLVAILATLAIVALIRFTVFDSTGSSDGTIAKGQTVPSFAGTTLDGARLDLEALRGHPVIVNFWGPSCVPCRDEFPLFIAKQAEHAADGVAIVGVLMGDPPEPAKAFAAEFGATWPTVVDAEGAIRAAYRVAARPQTYFIDRDGILRSIQIGEVVEADFERQYALISGR